MFNNRTDWNFALFLLIQSNYAYKWRVFILVFMLLPMLGACASTNHNQPLTQKHNRSYEFRDWINSQSEKLDSDLIVMSFSGGGVRAAALAEGVVDQIKDLGLANKIAIISSTSGGSVTAGFIAARGIDALPELRSQFLYVDNTLNLLPRLLPPLLLPSFINGENRSQKFATYLDEQLFQNEPQSYEKLMEQWHTAPFVILNATDLSTGRLFEFKQSTFNNLCSDLSQFSLSESIAASSSFPFLMNPIPLKNHWDNVVCRDGVNPFPPERFEEEYSAKDYKGRYVNLDAFVNARYIHSLRYTYDDDGSPNLPFRRIKYVHLIDGGLSDNLAARALLRAFSPDVLKLLQSKGVQRILLVQVNAKSDEIRDSIDQSGDMPSWIQVFKTVAFYPIDVATALSSYISKEYWVSLVDHTNKNSNKPGALLLYPVQVDFDQMTPSSKDQENVKRIGTWWSLSKNEVDLVRQTGKDLLRMHPCFKAFMKQSNSLDKSTCEEIIELARIDIAPAALAQAAAPAPARAAYEEGVLFDYGKISLQRSARTVLDNLISNLRSWQKERYQSIKIRITGYTDRVGSDSYNKNLSLHRAEMVKNYLINNGIPIPADRIYADGLGKIDSITSCNTNTRPELIKCLAPDRRVMIEIIW